MNSEVELAGAILGSNLVTSIASIYFSKKLGKKREDIETALRYQEFYTKHINSLNTKIEELTEKVNLLIKQNEEQLNIIEEQRNTILRWEDYACKQDSILKEKDKQISKLFTEIEEHEKREHED